MTIAQKWSRQRLGWPLPRLGRRRAFSLVGRGRQLLTEEGPRAGTWRRHRGGFRGNRAPPPCSPAVSWGPTPDTPDIRIGCSTGREGSGRGGGARWPPSTCRSCWQHLGSASSPPSTKSPPHLLEAPAPPRGRGAPPEHPPPSATASVSSSLPPPQCGGAAAFRAGVAGPLLAFLVPQALSEPLC